MADLTIPIVAMSIQAGVDTYRGPVICGRSPFTARRTAGSEP
jgi:hypothetical protein